MLLSYFCTPGMIDQEAEKVQVLAEEILDRTVGKVETELCFYVEATEDLSQNEQNILRTLLPETFGSDSLGSKSFLGVNEKMSIIEVGPRLNFETTWSSTAVEICHRSGIGKVTRFEHSRRFGFRVPLFSNDKAFIVPFMHDRMTEMAYPKPLTSFDTGLKPTPVQIVPFLERSIPALEEFSRKNGCGWDRDDLVMIEGLYKKIGRNPTDVELFQIAQANSDHSRHRLFKGKLAINGEPIPEENLMEIIMAPLEKCRGNSIIAFCDDSSAIRGQEISRLTSLDPTGPSEIVTQKVMLHPTLTAETHNFPTGVAPYPGAATGTGGRIRDNQAVGRGGLPTAGSAGYLTGHLKIPEYPRPWLENGWNHPPDLTSPVDILIQASNGASDYGNCFGEPVIYGVNREFEMLLPDGSYTAWFKPIMYTSGAGFIDDRHTEKGKPKTGMLVVQVGGPAYRIGMGGSAASSMEQGQNTQDLDFNAVQRGNPEMAQRCDRFVRACVELGDENPIVSAHDLGAGGDSNALPEIVEPAGARIELGSIPVGDKTLSILEIWGNESQERNAFLVRPDDYEAMERIAERENVPISIVGQITGDGYLVLHDATDGSTPVNLPLNEVLGQLPAKEFHFDSLPANLKPLELPKEYDLREILDRVLSLVSVGSKRFLTTKVDRSVTGRIRQQQCIGPLHTPISDYAIVKPSLEGSDGIALSLGEQPIIGLVNPMAGARMALSEALFNLIGAGISKPGDIKASANWMLASKQPGEGSKLYAAACAIRDMATDLGMAFDGGKDSTSMASQGIAPDGTSHTVKAPLTLVVAPYAPVPDISKRVTPDLKRAGNYLIYLPITGKFRLGGSALAQIHGQIGNDCPDIDHTEDLIYVLHAVHSLIEKGLVESIHDVSDGGLIVTLLEMALGGNTGLDIRFLGDDLLATCFSEESGIVIEVNDFELAQTLLMVGQVPYVVRVAQVLPDESFTLDFNGERVLTEELPSLRASWERTSLQIDKLQANPECVKQEEKLLTESIPNPPYRRSPHQLSLMEGVPNIVEGIAPKVAILREEGSNGDREMAAAFKHVGFRVYDVSMTDLIARKAMLEDYQMIAFVGGFSFGDVLGSGKGWASVIRHNPKLAYEFEEFFDEKSTLSLGVCNGCQVMALLGIPGLSLSDKKSPRFVQNTSGRFESRFSTVKVMPSPAIMFDGMADSILGVWVAHGEGRFRAEESIVGSLNEQNLLPLRYVDHYGKVTKNYPFNPNGSPLGITAICSPDGRHLAMMPHPERTYLPWHWPWTPADWKGMEVSPWLQFFQNAYNAFM